MGSLLKLSHAFESASARLLPRPGSQTRPSSCLLTHSTLDSPAVFCTLEGHNLRKAFGWVRSFTLLGLAPKFRALPSRGIERFRGSLCPFCVQRRWRRPLLLQQQGFGGFGASGLGFWGVWCFWGFGVLVFRDFGGFGAFGVLGF